VNPIVDAFQMQVAAAGVLGAGEQARVQMTFVEWRPVVHRLNLSHSLWSFRYSQKAPGEIRVHDVPVKAILCRLPPYFTNKTWRRPLLIHVPAIHNSNILAAMLTIVMAVEEHKALFRSIVLLLIEGSPALP
jgi:hypothetical protein